MAAKLRNFFQITIAFVEKFKKEGENSLFSVNYGRQNVKITKFKPHLTLSELLYDTFILSLQREKGTTFRFPGLNKETRGLIKFKL